MKLAILGDAHAGVRDGNTLMMEHQLRYLCEVFIPYCVEHDIRRIIQTGDMFDVRRHTNTAVLHEWKRRFFDLLKAHDLQMFMYVGNHDAYYKNTLTPNTLEEHLRGYDNIVIFDEPAEWQMGGRKFMFVPWICSENEEACMKAIRGFDAEICFGHFEIVGAKMEGSVCTEGLALSTFDRFKLCISGHFHIKGKYENVLYVGTPYQMSWADYGVPKGFHVLDTKTLECEFVENTNFIYHQITYNEDRDMDAAFDTSYKDKYVRVIIEHRDNYAKYEKWIMRLEVAGAAGLSIVEPYVDRDGRDSEIEFNGELNVLSTTDIIKEYVSDVYPEKGDKLTKMMLGLHDSARVMYGI